MNLCTNAYQAMEGAPGVISVTLKPLDMTGAAGEGDPTEPSSCILLQVSDTGKSIDQEHIERIFEPYFTTKEQGKGTGLGLSVVHGIVKSYGGRIEVESSRDKGSTFRIYLPTVEMEERSKEEETLKDAPRSHVREHILIVDDDPTVLTLEKKMLTSLGYQVSVFSESRDALASVEQHPDMYDLIITDYTMPSMTGETLARKVMSINKDIPLILQTGYSGKMKITSARKIGIRAHVLKPVVMYNLARTVRNVLDEKDKPPQDAAEIQIKSPLPSVNHPGDGTPTAG